MAKQYILSERDYQRLQAMLRWFERDRPKNTLRRLPKTSGGGGAMGKTYIAEVDSNATGGGYYNCTIQDLDATYWNTTTADHFNNTATAVVVLNLPECPETLDTTSHELAAGDKIICWQKTDDEGTNRYVGVDAARLTTECPA